MGGCSVRHLELPSQRILLQVPSGHEHPLFGSPDTVALPAQLLLAGARNHSGPPWRCRRTFPCRFASEGFTGW